MRPDGIRRIHQEHLGAGNVCVGGDSVVAQVRVDHDPVVVDVEVLGQREPDALRDATLDLAAHLRRVDHDPGIGGLHAVEDADLAGHPVHGDPEAVGVGR